MPRRRADAPELEAPNLEAATLEPAGEPRRPSRRSARGATDEDASRGSAGDGPEPTGTKISPDLAPLRVPIDRYHRHPDNPRRHPHLAELRESYRRWGQLKPIVVQAATGYIVAGNGLHEAMTLEGATEIAATVPELTETEANAYLLADNKLGEMGGYDAAALAALLDQQDATGTLAGTGYSVGDLDRMMRGLDNGRTEADDAPPLTRDEPWVQPGELYALGDHRLLVGDATDAAAWDRLLAGRTADAIWTDPPYGVGYYGKTDEHLRIAGDSRDHGHGWRKGAAHYFTDDRTLDTVWEIDRPKASREHPTMKPVELVERALLTATRRRDLVLDPFVGSGSTIIAAENTRRTAYAMDIDPRYAQVAIERWQAYTGKRAQRLE